VAKREREEEKCGDSSQFMVITLSLCWIERETWPFRSTRILNILVSFPAAIGGVGHGLLLGLFLEFGEVLFDLFSPGHVFDNLFPDGIPDSLILFVCVSIVDNVID